MDENNGWCSCLFIILVIWGAYSIFTGDESKISTPQRSYSAPSFSAPSYSNSQTDSYSSSDDERETPEEPENPYDQGSGHSAGYEWAERTGGSCNGNSNSFNEGCEEYYGQQENYDEQIDE